MITKQQIRGQMVRLRVFNKVIDLMEFLGRCPLTSEVADDLQLSPSSVWWHMVKLRGAKGLPMPITFPKNHGGTLGERYGVDTLMSDNSLLGRGPRSWE